MTEAAETIRSNKSLFPEKLLQKGKPQRGYCQYYAYNQVSVGR